MYEKLLQIILEAKKNDKFGAGVHDDDDKFGAGLDTEDEPSKPKPKPRPAPAPAPSSPTPTPEPPKPKPVSKKKFGLSQPARERVKELIVKGAKLTGKGLVLPLAIRKWMKKKGMAQRAIGGLGKLTAKAIKKSMELGQ